ncbi:MAG: metal ABC transporter permease [Gammaproteobacteria bacterium]
MEHPSVIAKILCHEVRGMFVVAPLVALGTAVSGFVIAHHADYPPGQMTVAILCLFLTLAWLYRFVVAHVKSTGLRSHDRFAIMATSSNRHAYLLMAYRCTSCNAATSANRVFSRCTNSTPLGRTPG